jgi:hypothetical protein
MKYIFIGNQKVVLFPKLRENQKEVVTSALIHIKLFCNFS